MTDIAHVITTAESRSRANAYLASLPDGLESFPECAIKTPTVDGVLDGFPQLRTYPDLPRSVRDYLTSPRKQGWIAEVVSNYSLLLALDRLFSSEQELFEHIRAYNIRMLSNPLYRVMMLLFSPTVIVMAATRKWGVFHRGSVLETEPVKRSGGRHRTFCTLSFPPYLFNELLGQMYTHVFVAALELNNAGHPDAKVVEVGTQKIVTELSWDS